MAYSLPWKIPRRHGFISLLLEQRGELDIKLLKNNLPELKSRRVLLKPEASSRASLTRPVILFRNLDLEFFFLAIGPFERSEEEDTAVGVRAPKLG